MSTHDEKVRLKIRLTEEEKAKLEHDAALCDLTQSEYFRQICLGRQPRPKQPPEFWELLDALYEVHDKLTEQRTKLQNKIRRASLAEKEQLRGEKQAITAQISDCRKKLKLNTGVEKRSVKIQDTMDMVCTNEEQHRQTEQERKGGVRSR